MLGMWLWFVHFGSWGVFDCMNTLQCGPPLLPVPWPPPCVHRKLIPWICTRADHKYWQEHLPSLPFFFCCCCYLRPEGKSVPITPAWQEAKLPTFFFFVPNLDGLCREVSVRAKRDRVSSPSFKMQGLPLPLSPEGAQNVASCAFAECLRLSFLLLDCVSWSSTGLPCQGGRHSSLKIEKTVARVEGEVHRWSGRARGDARADQGWGGNTGWGQVDENVKAGAEHKSTCEPVFKEKSTRLHGLPLGQGQGQGQGQGLGQEHCKFAKIEEAAMYNKKRPTFGYVWWSIWEAWCLKHIRARDG